MPKKRASKFRLKDVRNIVVVSDTHTGCRLSIVHPEGAALDDGGTYLPSKIQLKLWAFWQEFWESWVPDAVSGEPYIVVHNGDCIDGFHHNSTTQWSINIEDQTEHAYKLLKPITDACEGRLFFTRGTSAHVGPSSVDEERLAKRLGAIPNEEGQHARWELWKRIGGDSGPLCHFLHHIGTTSSSAHETSAINAELAAIYTDCGRFGHEPPLVVCRSHRHRCAEVRLPARGGYAVSMVTPAWQLRTPYSWRLAGARIATPQIGGSLIRIGDREVFTRHWVREIGRSKEE